MMLKLQKKLASSVAGCSPKRVAFDPARAEDIKEAITKTDIRMLIGNGSIIIKPKKGVSRVRANENKRKKTKGQRRGAGSRKGRATARTPSKTAWITKIRAQRTFLRNIFDRKIVTREVYKDLYKKAGGGLFRSVQHIKIYMAERGVAKKQAPAKKA